MTNENNQLFKDVSMTPSNPKWENMIKRQSELYDRSDDIRQICSKAV